MTGRRGFPTGWSQEFDGVLFRVVEGSKHGRNGAADDYVLEWLTPNGWRKVSFHPMAMMVDFLYQNEEVLYPKDRGFKGGEYLMSFLRTAVRNGWSYASTQLKFETRYRTGKGGTRSLFDPLVEVE